MIRFEKTAEKLVMLNFEHGRFADAWSILHVLSGFTIGTVCLIFSLPYVAAITVTLFALFAYEVWGAAIEIGEDVENALCDVAFGSIGVFVLYAVDHAHNLHGQTIWLMLGAFAALDALVLFTGWQLYLRDRRAHKPDNILRSTTTAAGRRAIHADNAIFFGCFAAFIPLALIHEWLGRVVTLIWLCSVFLVAYYHRKQVLSKP